jgi:hypothetical protein
MVATVLRSIAGTCDNPSGITPASGGMHESTPPPPPTANGLSEVPADTGSTTLPVDADSISTDEEGAINSPLPQTGNDVSEILADTGSLTLPADTDSIATGEEGAMTPP